MDLTFKCPECESELPLGAADAPTEVRCGGCGSIIPLSVSEDLRAGRAVDRCPVCNGGEFYRRKDFDQKRGVTVVVIAGLISAGFLFFDLVLWAFGVLGAAAMVDLLVYRKIGDLTVCYRCQTEFRGDYPRNAPDFDLHTADELELEWSREVERRQKRSQVSGVRTDVASE
jgi:DNA-directed RNA polymerase subunit RPC12/RpoP